MPAAPAVHRRAPLRHYTADTSTCGRPVLPPFTGGLHCGTSVPVLRRRDRLLPPFTGGLHCGPSRRGAVQRQIVRLLPPFTGGLHCGSAVQWTVACRKRLLLPPFTGGLHCGEGSATRSDRCGRLLPPFTGGLHCGGSALRQSSAASADAAPAVQRRAPLRHPDPRHTPAHLGCSRRSTAGSIAASRCRSTGAAPIRVLPPFTGGLHCGRPALDVLGGDQVLPPFNGGLHCGAPASRDVLRVGAVMLPPFNGGLHCGSPRVLS